MSRLVDAFVKLPSRTGTAAFLFTLACGFVALPAAAQYPDKPVKVIVPFVAGGGGDTLARTVTNRLTVELKQPIVIDNRAGAGGNLGAEIAARSAPDGYTLFYGTNGTHAINQSLYRKLPFDPVKDFAPVSRLTRIAAIAVVNPALPVNSIGELSQYAKKNPGKVTFASAGNGTTSHLAGELFKSMTGIDIVHVPYKGGAPAITDLIGGQVSMMIEVMPNAYQHVKAGKIRALAVTTAQRSAVAPDIPTIAESGVPGFEVSAWDGIWAPAGTPPAIVDRLNDAIRASLEDPPIREALFQRGAEPVPGTPAALGAHVVAEAARWAKVVRDSGATVD
jgi:tripartite-type tricarboxylate transporter receptor subunit TctC